MGQIAVLVDHVLRGQGRDEVGCGIGQDVDDNDLGALGDCQGCAGARGAAGDDHNAVLEAWVDCEGVWLVHDVGLI
ncbi:hypothetical protein N7492_006157 [Penicillium capsulatum]|uniref:Uncharacterized protein n=1 Tax=Penicillium capsulatum TaxID=69766 RepID=A0A9W9I101_9EURO|nr:hypothetical protein N7492_006157 [Penicillium capsulatum]KAJ6108808.1 hypothetical protein N7512_008645 [Penicillium capsulatum]